MSAHVVDARLSPSSYDHWMMFCLVLLTTMCTHLEYCVSVVWKERVARRDWFGYELLHFEYYLRIAEVVSCLSVYALDPRLLFSFLGSFPRIVLALTLAFFFLSILRRPVLTSFVSLFFLISLTMWVCVLFGQWGICDGFSRNWEEIKNEHSLLFLHKRDGRKNRWSKMMRGKGIKRDGQEVNHDRDDRRSDREKEDEERKN